MEKRGIERSVTCLVASEADLDRLSLVLPDSGGTSVEESKLMNLFLKGEERKREGCETVSGCE